MSVEDIADEIGKTVQEALKQCLQEEVYNVQTITAQLEKKSVNDLISKAGFGSPFCLILFWERHSLTLESHC